MKLVSLVLMFAMTAGPALAQDQRAPIQSSADKAVQALANAEAIADAAQPQSAHRRSPMFWSGLVLGIGGLTAAVLGVTSERVDTSSTGNAPPGSFQACVAQRSDPIYATNNCDALKGKNRALLWGGAAAGALGAVLMIGSTHTSAAVSPSAIRLVHTVRF